MPPFVAALVVLLTLVTGADRTTGHVVWQQVHAPGSLAQPSPVLHDDLFAALLDDAYASPASAGFELVAQSSLRVKRDFRARALDPAGTQSVSTYDPVTRVGHDTTIRVHSRTSELLTTSVRTTLDQGFAPIETLLTGHDDERRTTVITRDSYGRVIGNEVRELPTDGAFLSRTETIRNLLGWPTVSIAATDVAATSEDATTFGYNARGQQIRVEDAAGDPTSMTYSPFGELATRTLPHRASPQDGYLYDGYGRRRTHFTATGDTIAFEYDGRGDLVRERWVNFPSSDNVLTERVYDERGREVANYDQNLGRLSAGLQPETVVRTFTYDALDRVLFERVHLGGDVLSTGSVWTANATGWQRQVTYPSGKVVSRQFDAAGRLDHLDIGGRRVDFDWTGAIYAGRRHDWSGDAAVDPMEQQIALDGLGRGVRLSTHMVAGLGSGSPTNPAWADEYCEGTWDLAVCGAPLHEQTIARDALGRARSVQTLWGQHECTSSERSGRQSVELKKCRRVDEPRATARGAVNPEAGLLADRPAPWRGYNYDAEGRLITVFEQDGLLDPVVGSPTPHSITNVDVLDFVDLHDDDTTEPISPVDWVREDHVRGVLDIVERATGDSRWRHIGERRPGHQLAEVALDNASYPIVHDAYGRVTEGAGSSYVYGPRGRLVQATGSGIDEDYLYGADGELVQVENGKLHVIAYDGDQMVTAFEPGVGTNWEAVWGASTDQLVEYERFDLSANGRFVPITDHRNSIVGWWNADHRQMDDLIEYTPHGRITLKAPDGTTRCMEEGTGLDCVHQWTIHPFGFAGAYRSEHTGIVHMRARWYDPKLGQFLTHDPLGYLDSYNLYAYAGMDPINFWDPYGLRETNLADSAFVQEGFGNPADDNCADGGCFDTTTSDVDPTGAVGNARAADKLAMDTTDEIAAKNNEISEKIRDDFKRKYEEKEGPEALIPAAGFVVMDMWWQLTPQSGDELRISMATMALGAGMKGKGAIDDVAEVVGDIANTRPPGGRRPTFVNLGDDAPGTVMGALRKDGDRFLLPDGRRADGAYDFVVREGGEIIVGKGHVALSGGDPVVWAGEIRFHNGTVVEWNNASGHFRPEGSFGGNVSELPASAYRPVRFPALVGNPQLPVFRD